MANNKPTSRRRPGKLALIIGSPLLILAITFGIFQYSSQRSKSVKINQDLGKNQKVTAESSLYMTFPEKVNVENLIKNLEISDNIKGEISWGNKNIITFKPEGKLEEGKTYTIRVNPKALLASGKPINKELEFKYTVAGDPKLASHFPTKNAENITVDSKITMVFDRAIIPLSSVQGSGSKKYNENWPVTITPETKGRWRWMSTSTVEFIPKNGLIEATTYHVNVPTGIVSVIGDKTTEDFSWEFTTTRPKVISSEPSNDFKMAGPETDLVLEFNQIIDLEKAKEKIKLIKIKNRRDDDSSRLDKKENVTEAELPISLKYYTETIENKEEINKKKVQIIPNSSIDFKSKYKIAVEKGAKSISGEMGSRDHFETNFSTAGDLSVKKGVLEDRNRIEIVFSNPMNNESLKENITITPEVEGWNDLKLETRRWSDHRELVFWPQLKASTEYTVTINKNIKDKFKQNLKEDYSFKFTTPELDPRVNILSKGDFGIFEKGYAPIYPFEVVNVSEVNLEFARIPFEKFLNIRQSQKGNWRHKPNLRNYIGYKKFTLKPEGERNEWETLYLDLEKEKGSKLIPGIYGLSAKAPEYKNTYGKRGQITKHQYFAISNMALTLKYSGGKALVWVVDMKTGEGVKEADLRFHNLKGEKIIQGKSDQNGFFETKIDLKKFQTHNNKWTPEFWVTASKKGDFAFVGSNWNNGMSPWNFGISQDFHQPDEGEYKVDSYIYTERQAYRPGDTVNFKGLVRLRDSKGKISIPKKDIAIEIHDAKQNKIYDETLEINEFGSFNGEIAIDKESPLGSYSINAEIIPDENLRNNYSYKSFAVLEYRKPEYKVEITSKEENYFDGDQVTFDIEGAYYFGAPMSDAKVEWTATSQDYYFNKYTDGWYSFALEDVWCWWGCEPERDNIADGESKLGQDGHLEISLPIKLDDKSLSQIVTLEANVTDNNNQSVSNRISVPVHKSNVYVGVKTEDYAVMPNENAKVKVVTVNPDGTPKKNQKVTVKLFTREWNTIKKKNVDGEYYYENEPKDTFIRKTEVRTDKNGKGNAEILIDSGGSYRIIAETKDENGKISKSGTSIYGFSSTYINWPHSNHDRIDIIVDKPEYKVGDTAKLLIKSPYQGEGVKALITVERENVISKKVIDIKSNAQPVEIPITEEMISNAYVSAVIVKARQGENFDEETNKDTGAPGFKIGYAKLKVETKQKELKVKIETGKKKYGPGETVKVKIKTSDWQGKPVSSEVSLGVVDMSVHALLGFRMPNLMNEFYANQGLGVKTAQMLTYLIERFKAGSKGGGGGELDSKLRSNFKDTAYWNPNILTNENGIAEIEFKLPDNLTTWHLLGIANTKDNLFGAGVHEIIETKKVIIRPVRPIAF